jgi:hypothetical protein
VDWPHPRFGGNLDAALCYWADRSRLDNPRPLERRKPHGLQTALEDVRVDPDPNIQALLPLTLEHIIDSMDQVAEAVFPHRALKIQKLWMNRGMRKPSDMSTCKAAAGITKINNSLPLFPDGTNDSKFLDQELVGLIEWSLSPYWRKKFDLKGYVPTLGTKAKHISECEAIERNETNHQKRKEADDSHYNNSRRNKFRKSVARAQKNDQNNRLFFLQELRA